VHHKLAGRSSLLAGRSILIVEDEPLIAIEIVDAFKTAGAAIATTTSLKQALVLVEHEDLAAAILDHALGDGDSSQLCARLKERDIPFVIYSGFSKVDGVCSDGPLVQKPASTDVLIATVEGLLASKRRLKVIPS
jgi:DNA-binding response OmpR family regulator